MTVQEVSVISSADFAALSAPPSAPETVTDVALPQVSEPEPPEPPAVIEEATPEPVPSVVQPEVDDVPDLPTVEETPAPEPAPEPPAEPEEAVPQQADRIASDPVDAPPPDTEPDDVQREEVTEDAGEEIPQEPQDATAPEEATTEIVTEADKPAVAPTRSLRPPARRPTRSAEAPVAEPDPAPSAETAEAPVTSDATADAIADAVAAAAQPDVPLGPPLTGSELEGLRVSVGGCWNVGALSSEAQETTVTVFVAMNRDGKPDTGSIRMKSFEGGSQAAAKRVFDTARRAIIRCGAKGFGLPVEKYGQWREIEMKFNPEGMFW